MSARYSHLFGEAYTTPGSVEGAAWWIAPDRGEVSPEPIAATGGNQLTTAMGPEAHGRYRALMRRMDGLRRAAMLRPHWCLNVLGVEPSRQGLGIGSQLMQPILQRADESGLAGYLETMKAGNVSFYRRHGFEVVVEGSVDEGSRYWTMRRKGRAGNE